MARDLAEIRRDDAGQSNLTDSGDPELVAVGIPQNGAKDTDSEARKKLRPYSTLAWNKGHKTKFNL